MTGGVTNAEDNQRRQKRGSSKIVSVRAKGGKQKEGRKVTGSNLDQSRGLVDHNRDKGQRERPTVLWKGNSYARVSALDIEKTRGAGKPAAESKPNSETKQ